MLSVLLKLCYFFLKILTNYKTYFIHGIPMLWNDLLVEGHKHTHTYEAINLMQNTDLTEKSGTFIKHKNLYKFI